jgi:Domain of unknown function (DUF4347)
MNSVNRISSEAPLNIQLDSSKYSSAFSQADQPARSASIGPVIVPTDPNPPTRTWQTDEIVFIDPSVRDAGRLAADIRQNRPGVPVITLDPAQDGIAQITDFLNQYQVRKQVHIISLGNQGVAKIGAAQLSNSTLNNYIANFRSWGNALDSGATILFYGSSIGAGRGEQLVQQISQLTGASVAASTDVTGSGALRGDWDLERKVLAIDTNAIATQLVFSNTLLNSYNTTFTS